MKVSYNTISTLGGIITGDRQISSYRSGPDLVEFFNELGSNDNYGSSFGTRWKYAEERLKQLNGSPKFETAITAALDPRNFLSGEHDIAVSVNLLNEYLKYDGYEVFKDGLFYRCRAVKATTALNGDHEKVKNLIFAADGPKPEIVLEDAVNNDIKIVKNEQYCLVYEKGIPSSGLSWSDLVEWWIKLNRQKITQERIEHERKLYSRLNQSLASEPEKLFFAAYFKLFRHKLADKFPALIPQVYLHYDPYTIAYLGGNKRLIRQRMDFLLLLDDGKRVVIEIDGQQHYAVQSSTGQQIANPKLYSEMVAEDRRLKLIGYDIFRFGGHELSSKEEVEKIVSEFFGRLLQI